MRFDNTIPRITIRVKPPADVDLETIRIERIYRLAQRPAAVVLMEYEIPVVKQQSGQLVPLWQPNQLFEGSYADVSFIAGMLLDKCLYHLPLYRQHQRLFHAGVDLARSTLTNWFTHGRHPANDVQQLIPRQWKQLFQDNPLRSDLWGLGQ